MIHAIFLSAVIFSLTPTAQAGTAITCDGGDMSVHVDIADQKVETTLTVSNAQIPALRSCMRWGQRGERMGGKWRCPHSAGEDRFEVYPILAPINGSAFVRVVRWNGGRAEAFDLKNCQ